MSHRRVKLYNTPITGYGAIVFRGGLPDGTNVAPTHMSGCRREPFIVCKIPKAANHVGTERNLPGACLLLSTPVIGLSLAFQMSASRLLATGS